jgi:hypothetical protein
MTRGIDVRSDGGIPHPSTEGLLAQTFEVAPDFIACY